MGKVKYSPPTKNEIFSGILPCPKCGRSLFVDFEHTTARTRNSMGELSGRFICSKCPPTLNDLPLPRYSGKNLKILLTRAKKGWNAAKRPKSYNSPCQDCQKLKTFREIAKLGGLENDFLFAKSSPCHKCEWKDFAPIDHLPER